MTVRMAREPIDNTKPENRQMDYSTLNLDAVKSLSTLDYHSKGWHLSDSPGMGCAGNPPGYPSYFLHAVYDRLGYTPRTAPDCVIDLPGDDYPFPFVVHHEKSGEELKDTLRRLWNPLPLDHERTRLWIFSTYKHHQHCYRDEERPEFGRPGTLIYPVPDYNLKRYHEDPRFSEEYRTAAMAEIEAFNKQERDRAKRIATPDNHQAVVIIRRFYPEYQPELELIDNPPAQHVGQWWETEATRPTAETCARSQRWGKKHTFNGTWCQWCGRHAEELVTI